MQLTDLHNTDSARSGPKPCTHKHGYKDLHQAEVASARWFHRLEKLASMGLVASASNISSSELFETMLARRNKLCIKSCLPWLLRKTNFGKLSEHFICFDLSSACCFNWML